MANELESPEPSSCLPLTPPKPCPPSNYSGGDPAARYNLPGDQVEYEAAYWLVKPQLRTPTLAEVLAKLGTPAPYPTTKAVLDQEIKDLKTLVKLRDRSYPAAIADAAAAGLQFQLTPLSRFLQLQKHPFGAVFNTGSPQYRVSNVVCQERRINLSAEVVQTGRELARLFENETPGLYHRHALNWLLFNRSDLSPVRHARIWAALDLAIHAALAAAWHFKWAYGPGVSFRQRPWEYYPKLDVLFDKQVNEKGNGDAFPKGKPCPSPGTPRHPAYPSGHSTFSAAASALLQYFFRDPDPITGVDIPTELDRLADNIGQARLWGGVHWASDHTFGQAVGRAVAALIIDQLEQDCVPTLPSENPSRPPSDAEVRASEALRQQPCPDGSEHDHIPPRTGDEAERLAF